MRLIPPVMDSGDFRCIFMYIYIWMICNYIYIYITYICICIYIYTITYYIYIELDMNMIIIGIICTIIDFMYLYHSICIICTQITTI